LQITLTGKPAERRRLVQALEDFCREHAIAPEVRHAADLALEEHITNVLSHGGARAMLVRVRCEVDAGFLVIEVEDDGRSFDPATAPPVNTEIPLGEKPVGGLGIHLMREFMDEISYAREAARNVLRMKKRLSSGNH
jgi:serine/threonine-protein kinase RsbW